MSEKRSSSEVIKAIFITVLLIIIIIVGLCYYPIIKEKTHKALTYKLENPLERSEDASHVTLESQLDTFIQLGVEGKEVVILNYLNKEVYRSSNNFYVGFSDAKSGFIITNEDDSLQAAFIGDSWYALEILPIIPAAPLFKIENKGELINVK